MLQPRAAIAQTAEESLQRRIEVGQFHLKSGRWEEAAAVFEPLSQAPDAPPAVFRGLGEAYYNLGRKADATRALEQALQRGRDDQARLLLVDLESAERDGWPEAIRQLQAYLADNPGDVERRQRLADLLIYEGRIQEAVPQLATVVEARPNDANALLLYARTLAWTGSMREAAPVFDRALAAGAAVQNDDRKLIAQAQEAAGDTASAQRYYREHLTAKPQDADALAGLARTAAALGDKEEAAGATEKLRGSAIDDADRALEVARLDVRLGQGERAAPVFAAALQRDPDPRLALEYADLLIALDRTDEAVALVSKYPDDSQIDPASRLRILVASDDHQDEALALATRVMRTSGSNEAAAAARRIVLATPDKQLSLDLVESVARRYPSDAALQNKLANMLLARGQKQRAEKVLAGLRKNSPKNNEVLASLVATQVANGNYAGAKQSLAGAGVAVEKDARLLSLRAGLYFRDGDLDAARADYEAALALRPQLGEARIGLAEVALAQGDPARAEALLARKPKLPERDVARLRQRLAFQSKLERFRRSPSPQLAGELQPLLRAELERNPDRSDLRLTLAQILENSGRTDEAMAEYSRLQQVDPPLREAYLAPIRVHLARGEQDAAEAAFVEFQRRFPGQEDVAQARLFAGQGERRKRANDLAGAIESYRHALELAPRDAAIWNGMAGVHFAAGDAAAALESFERASECDPDDVDARRGRTDALLALAGEAMQEGDRSGADTYLGRAAAAAGDDVSALTRVAALAEANQNWTLLDELATRVPSAPEANEWRNRAAVARELGDLDSRIASSSPDEALTLIERGLELDPQRQDLLLLRAQALERRGDAEAALAAFRRAAAVDGAPAEAYAGQVRCLANLGRVAESRALLEEVERRDPQAVEAAELSLVLAEANVLKAEGRTSEALAAAERAAALQPDNPGVRATLAGLYTESGDLPRAIEEYQAVLQDRPDDADLYVGLAGAYFAGRQLDDARRAFDEALRLDPNNRRARIGRADVLAGLAAEASQAGDADEARQLARDSLSGSGDEPAALERTVETALSAGAYDVAEEAAAALPDAERRAQLLRWTDVQRRLAPLAGSDDPELVAANLELIDEALAADPQRRDLLLLRAQALERSGDNEAALQTFRRLAALPNPPAEAYAGQVRTLAALGRTREASRALANLRANDPAASAGAERVLLLAEAETAKRTGDRARAADLIERALALDPDDVDAQLTSAGIRSELGDTEAAIAAYRAVLEKRPGDVSARRGLAGALFARGDLDEAGALFDELLDEDPTDPALRTSRAQLWLATASRELKDGRLRRAERALDAALVLDPSLRDAMAMRLQIAVGQGEWDEAQELIAGVGDPAWRRELQAWLVLEQGLAQWRRAPETVEPAALLAQVERGLRSDPQRGDLLLARAQLLEQTGDERAALTAYERAAAVPDAANDALAGQVRMLTALRRFAEAERLLDRFVVASPEAANAERAKLHRARASALKDLGRTQEAFAAARDAVALEPNDAENLMLLGWIYLESGQPADAAGSFRSALEVRPDDPKALEGLASAAEAMGNWEAAERYYLQLEELPGGSFPDAARRRIALRRGLAQAEGLGQRQRYREAAELLESLRHHYPREADVWAASSEVRAQLGQGSIALEYAEQGLRLAPTSDRLHLARARALAKLGRYQEAQRALAAAQEYVDPSQLARVAEELERTRARADRERWNQEGRLDLVYLSLAEEYQRAPGDADTLKSIGYLYLRTQQYPEARHFFERAARRAPNDPDARLGLAYALRGEGDAAGATRALEAIFEERPTAEVALALAELYHQQGRAGRAQEMLAEVRRLGGDTRRVLPPLHIDQAAMPQVRGTTLPPLRVPQGAQRAVPDRGPAVPEYDPYRVAPPASDEGWWRDGSVRRPHTPPYLAFAETDVVNDAAPPAAAAFAGPALESMRRAMAAGESAPGASEPLAQSLPSFDRVMEDVRGGRTTPRPRLAPIYEPVYVEPAPPSRGRAEQPIRDEHLPVEPAPYGGQGRRYGAP